MNRWPGVLAVAAALALSTAAQAADPPDPPKVTVNPVWVPGQKEWRFELVVQDFGISSFHVGNPPKSNGHLLWFLNLLENKDWNFEDGQNLLGDVGWGWQLGRVADDANVHGDLVFSVRGAGLDATAPANWEFKFDYVWTDPDTDKLVRTFFALAPAGIGGPVILRSEPALPAVPEPGTGLLAALGLCSLLWVRRKAGARPMATPLN